MHIDIWLGDSFVYGQELELDIPGNVHELSATGTIYRNRHRFPTIVSKHRNTECHNLAFPGSSMQYSVHQLLQYIKKHYSQSNTYSVFMCTTAASRDFYIDSWYNDRHIHKHGEDEKHYDDSNYSYIPVTETDMRSEFYRATMVYNFLYTLSLHYKFDLVIIPLWHDIEYVQDINIVPEDIWLCNTAMYDYNSISDDLKAPNKHPNTAGHQMIAEKIIKKLENGIENG